MRFAKNMDETQFVTTSVEPMGRGEAVEYVEELRRFMAGITKCGDIPINQENKFDNKCRLDTVRGYDRFETWSTYRYPLGESVFSPLHSVIFTHHEEAVQYDPKINIIREGDDYYKPEEVYTKSCIYYPIPKDTIPNIYEEFEQIKANFPHMAKYEIIPKSDFEEYLWRRHPDIKPPISLGFGYYIPIKGDKMPYYFNLWNNRLIDERLYLKRDYEIYRLGKNVTVGVAFNTRCNVTIEPLEFDYCGFSLRPKGT